MTGILLGPGSALAAPGYVPHELLVGYRNAGPSAATVAFEAALGVHGRRLAPAPHSQLLHLRRGESVMSVARRLRRRPGVAFAEPNYIATAGRSVLPR